MKKFLVLYKSSVPAGEQMAKATPEQAKAGMDLWMGWAKEAGKAIVDLGNPLGNPTKVAPDSVGPVESKIAGFSIMQAESVKALGELLKKHPNFKSPGAMIKVLEFLPMPGIPQK